MSWIWPNLFFWFKDAALIKSEDRVREVTDSLKTNSSKPLLSTRYETSYDQKYNVLWYDLDFIRSSHIYFSFPRSSMKAPQKSLCSFYIQLRFMICSYWRGWRSPGTEAVPSLCSRNGWRQLFTSYEIIRSNWILSIPLKSSALSSSLSQTTNGLRQR